MVPPMLRPGQQPNPAPADSGSQRALGRLPSRHVGRCTDRSMRLYTSRRLATSTCRALLMTARRRAPSLRWRPTATRAGWPPRRYAGGLQTHLLGSTIPPAAAKQARSSSWCHVWRFKCGTSRLFSHALQPPSSTACRHPPTHHAQHHGAGAASCNSRVGCVVVWNGAVRDADMDCPLGGLQKRLCGEALFRSTATRMIVGWPGVPQRCQPCTPVCPCAPAACPHRVNPLPPPPMPLPADLDH